MQLYVYVYTLYTLYSSISMYLRLLFKEVQYAAQALQ